MQGGACAHPHDPGAVLIDQRRHSGGDRPRAERIPMIGAIARRCFAGLREAGTSGQQSACIDLDEDINVHDKRLDGRSSKFG